MTSVATINETVTQQQTIKNEVDLDDSSEKTDIKKLAKTFTNSDFTRKAVESDTVRLTDKSDEFDLFCYTKCDNTNSSFHKQCRGLIYHKDQLVLKSFPYTDEYTTEEVDGIKSQYTDFSECTFYDSYEGALVRVFYWKDKWHISTHRKLNAFRSKWSCKQSFGALFKKCLEDEAKVNPEIEKCASIGTDILQGFMNTLDEKKQYLFLICNNDENRIVCQAPDRYMTYHVGTYEDGVLDMDVDVNIQKPTRYSFKSIGEVIEWVESSDIRKVQGVICTTQDLHFKIVNPDYRELFNARGNEPSINFRYLQVRMNRRITNMLYHLYPDNGQTFDEYENYLYEISKFIYKSYIQRYIRRNYITLPREEFGVMSECHEWYLSNRTTNTISLEKVIETVNKQRPSNLNSMIRRYRIEQFKLDKHTNTQSMIDSLSPELNSTILPSGLEMGSPLLLSQKRGNLDTFVLNMKGEGVQLKDDNPLVVLGKSILENDECDDSDSEAE